MSKFAGLVAVGVRTHGRIPGSSAADARRACGDGSTLEPSGARRVEIESLCPFPVATVLWEPKPGRPSLTVCVKATYALIHGRTAEIAGQQILPCDDIPSDAAGSLYAPSDFVPLKKRVDILIVGHAYTKSLSATDAIVARASVCGVSKARRVTADRSWIGSPDGFGPIPADVRVRTRARPLRDDEARWALHFGAIAGPPPQGFDYGFFNVAPPDQQLDALPSTLSITLENLGPTRPLLETRLPVIQPRAFRVSRRTGLSYEVTLRCDTVWIDCDRGIAVMSWRGVARVPTSDEEALGRLLITTDKHPDPLVPNLTRRDAPSTGTRSMGASETAPVGSTMSVAQNLLRSPVARALPAGWVSSAERRPDPIAATKAEGGAAALVGLPFKPRAAEARDAARGGPPRPTEDVGSTLPIGTKLTLPSPALPFTSKDAAREPSAVGAPRPGGVKPSKPGA